MVIVRTAILNRTLRIEQTKQTVTHILVIHKQCKLNLRRGKSTKSQELQALLDVLSFCIPYRLASVYSCITDMSMDLDTPIPIAGDQQPVAATYVPLSFSFFLFFFFFWALTAGLTF